MALLSRAYTAHPVSASQLLSPSQSLRTRVLQKETSPESRNRELKDLLLDEVPSCGHECLEDKDAVGQIN